MGWFMTVNMGSAIASTAITGMPISSGTEIPSLEAQGNGASTGAFRLMSYNVRVDHEQDAYTENRWSERAGRVLHVVSKYASDLYTFQEPNESQVADLTQALGDDYEWIHYRASEKAYETPADFESEQHRETQAIAFRKDRFELLDSGRFWLAPTPNQEPKTPVWDASPFSRVAVYAKLYDRVSETALTVITAHFDHKGVEARKHSIELMVSHAKEISEGGTFLLTGDFNTFENKSGYSEIYSAFMEHADALTDVRELADETYGPISSWVGWDYNNFSQRKLEVMRPGVPCRWDHIFLANDKFDVLRTAVIDDHFAIERDGETKEVYPSDHRPIVSDLIIKQ